MPGANAFAALVVARALVGEARAEGQTGEPVRGRPVEVEARQPGRRARRGAPVFRARAGRAT